MKTLLSKKTAPILFLILFYGATVFLSALCPTTASASHHHQKQRVHHSLSCLLACSSLLAKDAAAPQLPAAHLLFGALFILFFFPFYKSDPSHFRTRAPPCAE